MQKLSKKLNDKLNIYGNEELMTYYINRLSVKLNYGMIYDQNWTDKKVSELP